MIKKRKLLFILSIVTVIFIIGGTIFISILDDGNRELVKNSVSLYFNNISYWTGSECFKNIFSQLLLSTLIFIMGFSIVGMIILFFVVSIKGFILGFSFSSIIYTYRIKGILPAIIYAIPEIIYVMIYFVLCYYAISFSLILFKYLFRKVQYNKDTIIKRYFKIFICCNIGLIINSLIEGFIIPYIMKLF